MMLKMDKDLAHAILKDYIQPDGCLHGTSPNCLSFYPGCPDLSMDGDFTVHELQAILWWMENTPAIQKTPYDLIAEEPQAAGK